MTGIQSNPYEAGQERAEDVAEYGFLEAGVVSGAPTGQSKGAHHVFVQETTTPQDGPVPVLPPAHGDYYIPPDGTPVVLAPAGKNDYYAIGMVVEPGAVPTIDPGERIISHPESKSAVRFNNDGSMDVHAESEVRINGGTQGAITDVSAGSTNSNGGITSLDITRESTIKI